MYSTLKIKLKTILVESSSQHLTSLKYVVVHLAAFRLQMAWPLSDSHCFCWSAHNRLLISDEKWPSVRDTASTTSWTHPPTVSSSKLGPGKNASCLNLGLLLFCVRNCCHFNCSLSNFWRTWPVNLQQQHLRWALKGRHVFLTLWCMFCFCSFCREGGN